MQAHGNILIKLIQTALIMIQAYSSQAIIHTRVYEIKVSIFYNFLLLSSFWKHSINDIWLDSALFIQVVQINGGRTVATHAFANYAPVKHDYITLTRVRILIQNDDEEEKKDEVLSNCYFCLKRLWLKWVNYQVMVYSYYLKRIGTYFIFTRKFWEFI